MTWKELAMSQGSASHATFGAHIFFPRLSARSRVCGNRVGFVASACQVLAKDQLVKQASAAPVQQKGERGLCI